MLRQTEEEEAEKKRLAETMSTNAEKKSQEAKAKKEEEAKEKKDKEEKEADILDSLKSSDPRLFDIVEFFAQKVFRGSDGGRGLQALVQTRDAVR